MDIKDLKNALYEGIVIFEFVKKNGEHRKARGTTCPDIVPTDDKPKGKRTPEQQPSLSTTSIRKVGAACASTRSGRTSAPSNFRSSLYPTCTLLIPYLYPTCTLLVPLDFYDPLCT